MNVKEILKQFFRDARLGNSGYLKKASTELMFEKKQKSIQKNAAIFDAKIRSLHDFSSFCSEISPERQIYETDLAHKCSDAGGSIELPGICEVCGEHTVFHLDFLYSDGTTPNFRERLVCPKCGLNNRQRCIVSTVLKEYIPEQKIYMYEQVTSVFETIQSYVGTENVVGSEYIKDGLKSGVEINGILHEDAECLSFSDCSFDIVVSCDVFEHVNDYEKCFIEAVRILRPGGKLFFSVPFHTNRQNNHRRAGISADGELIQYDDPIFHGNPMSDEGSLVFWDYGWDMLDDLKRSGFQDAFMLPYYSKEYGYLGGVQFMFVAIK